MYILFTSENCPRCPTAKETLQPLIDKGTVEVVDVMENKEYISIFNIKSVPILIGMDDKQNEIKRFTFDQLKKFVEEEGV